MSAFADPDGQKRRAGEAAALEVRDGMAVGLGTGSTAAWFVRALAERTTREGLRLRCVATSEQTRILADELGLACEDLDAVGRLDLTVDGADEIGPGLSLIKGGGGALLREKLVWEASDRCLVIADAAKRVATLGRFPLPVEIVEFGHATTAARVAAIAGVGPSRRAGLSDNGGVIYDLPLGAIEHPERLAAALKAVTGVVEHGLFLGLATEALIGTAGGVERIAP